MISSGPILAAFRCLFPFCLALGLEFTDTARLGAQGAPVRGQRFPADRIDPMDLPVQPVVVCFPPTPPPLDRAISRLAPMMPPRLTPPTELAACVNEPFYAPLSTWLLEHALTEKMRQR